MGVHQAQQAISMGQHSKADAECVRVVVRCRPLNEREKADGRTRIVDMDRKSGQVVLRNSKADATDPPKSFTFDSVFDWESTQKEVYESTAAGIVNSTLEGYNGTIFAYGQTGTGKTHTMEGYAAEPSQQGIIPQSFEHIFSAIEGSSNIQYLVRASFLEIYNEEIRDLLSKSPKDKLELKESKDSGVYVKGLNAFVVKSVPEIRNVLEVRWSPAVQQQTHDAAATPQQSTDSCTAEQDTQLQQDTVIAVAQAAGHGPFGVMDTGQQLCTMWT